MIGTDVSHWEGVMDFNRMQKAGAGFCIFKATQGRYYTDPSFLKQWNDAAGMIRGAYHFLDWSADADRQAEHFCDVIAGHQLDFPPVVDFEYYKAGLIRTEAVAALWTFIHVVEDKTGRVPMIYTGPSYWRTYGSTAAAWLKYPLWIANYGVSVPSIPAPWTSCILWQYTDKGSGPTYGCQALGVDLNYYDGTMADLRAYLGMEISTKTRDWCIDDNLKAHGYSWQ